MSLPIDVSIPEEEGALQVSKSRKLPLLIDRDEMEALFQTLGEFSIFDVSHPLDIESAKISKEDFIINYGNYVAGIKKGELVDEAPLRPFFSSIITTDPKLIYAMILPNGKYLIKARRPVIQLQRHHFIFSEGFHSGVMGEGSISWGIQFSYPQLCLDPKTQAISKVEKNGSFPNTELFGRLAKWVRHHTSATPFIYNGEKHNVPIRLGKQCFSWIQKHPRLKEKELYVYRQEDPQPPH